MYLVRDARGNESANSNAPNKPGRPFIVRLPYAFDGRIDDRIVRIGRIVDRVASLARLLALLTGWVLLTHCDALLSLTLATEVPDTAPFKCNASFCSARGCAQQQQPAEPRHHTYTPGTKSDTPLVLAPHTRNNQTPPHLEGLSIAYSRMSPAVYLRNRLRSAATSALEKLARRSGPLPWYEVNERCHKASWWNSHALQAEEHPELPGLWLWRRAVDASGVDELRALVAAIVGPTIDRGVHIEVQRAEREAALLLEKSKLLLPGTEQAVEAAEQANAALSRRDALREQAAVAPPPPALRRSSTHWEWYDYEPGRFMAPVLSHPAEGGASLDVARRHLCDFEVFGGADVASWLSLDQLAGEYVQQESKSDHGVVERAAVVARGAARLRRVQADLAAALPCVQALPGGPLCMFHQLQLLERGASIAAHVDAPTPPADVVSTISLSSAPSTVRVGHVHLSVDAGDAYAISGKARWEVSHEVHAGTSDRLSVTVRYAGRDHV